MVIALGKWLLEKGNQDQKTRALSLRTTSGRTPGSVARRHVLKVHSNLCREERADRMEEFLELLRLFFSR